MRPLALAAALAGGYTVLAVLYILFSGDVAAAIAASVEDLQELERLKGLVFVGTTGVLAFLSSWLMLRRVARGEHELAARREQLLEAEARAQAGVLASSVVHDLRNMLTVVVGGAEELRRHGRGDAEAEECARAMESAVEKADGLLGRLRGIARRAADEEPVATDLGVLAAECVSLARRHRSLADCEVLVESAAAVVVPVQPGLVMQAVTNLVLNAAEATVGPCTILVRVAEDDGAARIEVHDSGEGLVAGVRERMFDAFVTTKANGTGLGLVSVARCAKAHGGAVDVGESPLGGAAFVLTLSGRRGGAESG